MPNACDYGEAGDSASQAHMLFARLREFDDRPEITQIYARMPSSDGVGLAVLNRLIRAAGFNIVTLSDNIDPKRR